MNKQKLKYFATRYFLTALNGMAIGLFASLIIGTILATLIKIPFLDFLTPITTVTSSPLVYSAAIGCGIALSLKHKPIVVVGALVAAATSGNLGGGPLGAYVAALVACEVGGLVCGKTKIDIIVTPLVTILVAGIIAIITAPAIGAFMTFLGTIINNATNQSPLIMGILVSVLVGIFLTLPISSAAICISLEISGIAAGAAVVGCCVQMLGFAIQTYKSDKLSGFISVGIGTSMLQFTNIVRKPLIWLPTIITSAILGPISTCLFKMENTSFGAGMGTCGFVGQINAFNVSSDYLLTTIQVLSLHILLPIVLVFGFNMLFIKLGLYSHDDFKLYRDTEMIDTKLKEEINNENIVTS